MAEFYESEAFIYNRVPVRIFNHEYYGTSIFTSLHWHRNIEFNLTTGGRIRMNIDGENMNLLPGDWCIVNSGELHSNHWIEPEDEFFGVCVQLSKSFVDRWIGEGVRFVVPEDEEVRKYITSMIEKFGQYKKEKRDDL